MTLSNRQEDILKKIVSQYIKQAEPISSDYLKRKYKTDLSPATIRNEMQKLTDMGYLYQPHTSAGRVPADKGYRYLVDSLISKEIDKLIDETIRGEIDKIKEIEDTFSFIQKINRILSNSSSGLVFSYLPQEDLCLRENWINVFKGPEFSLPGYTRSFLSMIDNLEKSINCFEMEDFTVNVFIGQEVPMPRCNDFSIVISRCFFKDKETFLAILGPKRMSYTRNIPLINSVIKILKNNEI
jgi:transcriptional regulator of heat shock response